MLLKAQAPTIAAAATSATDAATVAADAEQADAGELVTTCTTKTALSYLVADQGNTTPECKYDSNTLQHL